MGWKRRVPTVLHDRVWGLGGMGTLIYNRDANNQFRFVTSLRRDDYQIPNDPDAEAAGIRDRRAGERRARQVSRGCTRFDPACCSPFRLSTTTTAPTMTAIRMTRRSAPTQHRGSQYAGAQIAFSAVTKKHNASVGLYGFGQHDDESVGLIANDGSGLSVAQDKITTGPSGNAVSGGSIQGVVVADAHGGRAPYALQRRDFRECSEPAARRSHSHPAFELGPSRLLGRVLPGAAALHGQRSIARFCRIARAWLHSSAGRARPGAPIRAHDSPARVGS